MWTTVSSCGQSWCRRQTISNNESPRDEDDVEMKTTWNHMVHKVGNVLGNHHHYQLGIIVVLAILTFFPIFANMPSLMENSILRDSLTHDEFRITGFIILSLSFVFFADFLIDFVSEKSSRNAYRRYSKHKNVMVDSEILVYVVGTILVPIVTLPSMDDPRLALIYTCASQSSLILLSGFVSIMCSRYFRNYFPAWVINVGIVLLGGASMFTPWIINQSAAITNVRIITYYLKFVGGGIFVLYSLRWIYFEFIMRLILPILKHHYYYIINTSAEAKRKEHQKDSLYFPIMYAMSALVSIFFIAFSGGAQLNSNFYDLTPYNLLWFGIPVLGFQVCMLLVKSQFSKYEVVENLYSLETAAAMLANYPRMSMDSSPLNVTQHRPVFSGGRNVSSIQLFLNHMRAGDGRQPLSSALSPRVHVDDSHDDPDLGLINRSLLADVSPVGDGTRSPTGIPPFHHDLVHDSGKDSDVRNGRSQSGHGSGSGMDSEPRPTPNRNEPYTVPNSSNKCGDDGGDGLTPISPSLTARLNSSISAKTGEPPMLFLVQQALMEAAGEVSEGADSEGLGESPDVFGFNLPNHRPRIAMHTHSQGPLSSLSDPLSLGSGHLPLVHNRVLFESQQPGGIGGRGEYVNRDHDVDEDLLTLLSSISLSETRKHYHKKQNPQKINVAVTPSYRLLVVDDSGLLCIALRTDNHICDEVRQQPYQDTIMHKLLNQPTDQPYDAVLVNVKDDGLGPVLAQSIRALAPTVPIFGVTDRGHKDSERFIEIGVFSVLHKPFSMEFFLSFLSQIDALYEKKQSREIVSLRMSGKAAPMVSGSSGSSPLLAVASPNTFSQPRSIPTEEMGGVIHHERLNNRPIRLDDDLSVKGQGQGLGQKN